MELCNTVEKNTKAENTLLSNPFRRDFEHGKARDGYWNGRHTSNQLEDCID